MAADAQDARGLVLLVLLVFKEKREIAARARVFYTF